MIAIIVIIYGSNTSRFLYVMGNLLLEGSKSVAWLCYS